ncbi:MAG: WG repeat-containing protein [Clostridia bacterium]|nr:WG repeat-containing protein [Clostridia bacterium]
MKRSLFCLIVLCLMPLAAFAGEGKPLYAVKDDNGLWGYIDCRGNPVIPGTFSWAEDFRGDYALACAYPEGIRIPDNEEGQAGVIDPDDGKRMPPEGLYGVIDTRGRWVVPPVCSDVLSSNEGSCYAGGRDTGVYWFTEGTGDQIKQGFFDIPSGFFSGMAYDRVAVSFYGGMDAELIGVIMDGKLGFANRTTGEIVIPCRYSPADIRDFRGDFCMVVPIGADDEDAWLVIDRTGREIPMPENCCAGGDFHEGLAAVRDTETDLYGYIDEEGRFVIGPQYTRAYDFSEGLARIYLYPDVVFVDREGNERYRFTQ